MYKSMMWLAMFCCLFVVSSAHAQIPWDGVLGDDVPTLVYDPAAGNLSMEAAGKQITTLEIISASGVFTGVQPSIVLPPFDVFQPGKFFILKTDGIGDTDFGPVMASGLRGDFLASDLTVSGSVLPSGPLQMDLLRIPEPSTIVMYAGLLLVAPSIRRRAGSQRARSRSGNTWQHFGD